MHPVERSENRAVKGLGWMAAVVGIMNQTPRLRKGGARGMGKRDIAGFSRLGLASS